MFRSGNPFVRAREEPSSTHRASHLRAGLSLSWPSHVHIQPNLLKSYQLCSKGHYENMLTLTLTLTLTQTSQSSSLTNNQQDRKVLSKMMHYFVQEDDNNSNTKIVQGSKRICDRRSLPLKASLPVRSAALRL